MSVSNNIILLKTQSLLKTFMQLQRVLRDCLVQGFKIAVLLGLFISISRGALFGDVRLCLAVTLVRRVTLYTFIHS